jgi:hypothetical protein
MIRGASRSHTVTQGKPSPGQTSLATTSRHSSLVERGDAYDVVWVARRDIAPRSSPRDGTIVTRPAWCSPFAGMVLGGPVAAPRLTALAGRLEAGGWLVMADPKPADMRPIEHALARRRALLATGLEAFREPPARGRGVIEVAAWIARRRVTVDLKASPAIVDSRRCFF